MIVRDVLNNVGARAGRELDRMSDRLPQVKEPALPFGEYLSQAMEYAKTNEKFARELARALYQAKQSGGFHDGSS